MPKGIDHVNTRNERQKGGDHAEPVHACPSYAKVHLLPFRISTNSSKVWPTRWSVPSLWSSHYSLTISVKWLFLLLLTSISRFSIWFALVFMSWRWSSYRWSRYIPINLGQLFPPILLLVRFVFDCHYGIRFDMDYKSHDWWWQECS